MKKFPLLPLGLVALFTLPAFIDPTGSLLGRWQKRLPDAILVGTIFRADSSFDISVNGKLFANGKYYVRQDTFAMSDGSCGATYYGRYKLDFFAEDSVRFTVIEDLCKGRRNGMNGSTMGRVKPTKP